MGKLFFGFRSLKFKLWTLTFALACLCIQETYASDFGVEGGRGVENASEAVEEIYGQTYPDLEVILSYAMFTENISGLEDINPFGHIAIALLMPDGYRVVTVNQKATSGQDKLFFQLTPADYFYRVEPMPGAIHGSHIGLAYARSSVSLQIFGLSPAALDAIRNKIDALDQEHAAGQVSFCVRSKNCAHLTTEILSEASIVTTKVPKRFPVAVFDEAVSFARSNADQGVSSSLAFYKKVASDHRYTYENIPVPGYRFFANVLSLLGFNTLAHLSDPTRVVALDKETMRLTIANEPRLQALAASCESLWILPFVRAILRKDLSK